MSASRDGTANISWELTREISPARGRASHSMNSLPQDELFIRFLYLVAGKTRLGAISIVIKRKFSPESSCGIYMCPASAFEENFLSLQSEPIIAFCQTPSTGRCRRGRSEADSASNWWKVEPFWSHPPPIFLQICPTRHSITGTRGRCLTEILINLTVF